MTNGRAFLSTMDENIGRRTRSGRYCRYEAATGSYGVRKIHTFQKNLKCIIRHFFSSSLQITFLHNSSTLLCLKEHQKAHDLPELQWIWRVLLEVSSLGTSY